MIESFLGDLPTIHELAYVHPSAVLIGDVQVGAHASIWPNTTLRADDAPIVIGENTSIQDNSVVHATIGMSKTVVGARVTVGHSVILHGCTVHDECLIGMGSTILDNAVIETGSLVGAGTLIPPGKVVKTGTLVMGNPFKVVRELTQKERQWIAFAWREYTKRGEQYRTRDAGTK